MSISCAGKKISLPLIIPNYSNVLAPLQGEMGWADSKDAAFRMLKYMLAYEQVLCYYNPERHLKL